MAPGLVYQPAGGFCLLLILFLEYKLQSPALINKLTTDATRMGLVSMHRQRIIARRTCSRSGLSCELAHISRPIAKMLVAKAANCALPD